MKKYILFSLLSFFFVTQGIAATPLPPAVCGTPIFGPKIELSSGTIVTLELAEKIESNRMTVGQLVKFKVSAHVIVDGRIVIRTGARALGRVKSITPSTYNDPEELHLEVTSVQAVDGQQITLNGAEQIIKGLYPGQGTTAELGTTITATVMNDEVIKMN